jgi:hypothetical protein
MRQLLNGVLAVAAMAGITFPAKAAVVSVQPVVGGYFDTAFNPIPAPMPIGMGTANTGVPTVVQIDIYMSVLELAPGEDSFGTAAFSIQHQGFPGFLGAIEPNVSAGGYNAYLYPLVDINGPVPPGANTPLFAQNADLGVSPTDLIGILIQMATGAFTNALDPRRNVGEPTGITLPSGDSLAGPMLLGSAYLTWNGLGMVQISLDPVQVSAKTTGGLFVAGQATPSAQIFIGFNVPEPSALAILSPVLAGIFLRRRAARGRPVNVSRQA